MDLDQMMSKIYVPNTTRDRRLTSALAEYTDIRIQYGRDSAEEEKAYTVLVNIFPEMELLRGRIRYIEAAIGRGEFQLLPGDLEAVGLKE